MSTTGTIPLADEITLILSVTDGKGKPVPNAVISNVQWNMDNKIGEIVTDPNNPSQAIFKPSKAGVVSFQATATITVS
jgi:protocatechuate 3,4-dioxygenase beta subunit